MTALALVRSPTERGEPTPQASSARPMVVIDDLRIHFGPLAVIEGMSLTIGEGEFITFLGPSGCGKSTLLKAIAGLRETTSGQITLRDRALRLGLMFQKPLLLPWRTLIDNVLLPIEIELGGNVVSSIHRSRAMDLLCMMQLNDFAAAYPHELSGGMQQRAALARALISDPDVLLLDEPFGALDELRREVLNEELIDIWRSRSSRLKAVVMVTHSVPEAVTMSDRVLVLGSRPARILRSVDVELDYPRQAESPDVQALVGEIRNVLRSNR